MHHIWWTKLLYPSFYNWVYHHKIQSILPIFHRCHIFVREDVPHEPKDRVFYDYVPEWYWLIVEQFYQLLFWYEIKTVLITLRSQNLQMDKKSGNFWKMSKFQVVSCELILLAATNHIFVTINWWKNFFSLPCITLKNSH